MAIDFIDNQPIRFNSNKFDDQSCLNKDDSEYAILMQPGDPLHWQGKLNCCGDDISCDADDLGSELVVNGDFSSAVGWGSSGGWAINTGTGQATFTAAGANGSLVRLITLTTGKPHQVQINVVSNDTGYDVTVFLGGAEWVIIPSTFTGLYTGYAVAGSAATISISLQSDYGNAGTGTLVIDLVSVKEMATCYTFDTSIREYVSNGAFTGSSSGWTLDADWTWNAGNFVRHTNTAGTGFVSQLVTGMRHRADILFSVTVSNRTLASIGYLYGGVTMVASFGANGLLTFHYPANTLGDDLLRIRAAAAFDGDIDDISATETNSGWSYNPLTGFTHYTGWSNAFYAGNTLIPGTYYKLTVEVLFDVAGGSLVVDAGGINLATITTNGIYDLYFTALTTAGESFTPSTDFAGTVKIAGLCELITDIQTRLVYEDGITGATDFHTINSSFNPVKIENGFVRWSVGTLSNILSGGVPISLSYTCYRMQVRFSCVSTDTDTTYTSDNAINYKANHPCTKQFIGYCNGDALGFRFDFGGVPGFRLYMRMETLYFNPKQSYDAIDYEFSSGLQSRSYATRKKRYEMLFNYADEYAYDVIGVMIVCDFMIIDTVRYLADAKDFDPDWAERGKRNLAQATMEFQKSQGVLFNRNCS